MCIYFSVSTDLDGKNAWKECFKVENVLLPTGYYFGASATTGDLSDIHDIISMRMYELDLLESVRKLLRFCDRKLRRANG